MKTKIFTVCAVFVMLLASAAVFYYFTAEKPPVAQPDTESTAKTEDEKDIVASLANSSADESADASSAAETIPEQILFKMNDPFLIRSRQYKQGTTRTEDFNMGEFGWQGDMQLTVKGAALYDTAAEAGIPEEDIASWEERAASLKDPVYLSIDMDIENIDAYEQYGVQYDFHFGFFTLQLPVDYAAENWQNPDYFPPLTTRTTDTFYFSLHGGDGAYYHLELPAGESTTAQLVFGIERDAADEYGNTLILKAGANATNRFGFCLDQLADHRKNK